MTACNPAWVAGLLGWQGLDLFGCSPGFARRLDPDGLAMLLDGRAVLGITEQAATIGNPHGTGPRSGVPPCPGAVLPLKAQRARVPRPPLVPDRSPNLEK